MSVSHVNQASLVLNAKQDQSISDLKNNAKAKQARQVAEDFESLFMDVVMKSMRQTVHKSGFMDGGNAENIYQSMLDSEYSKMMASSGSTGFADKIESFILENLHKSERIREIANKNNAQNAYNSGHIVKK